MNKFAIILILIFLTTVSPVAAKNDNNPSNNHGSESAPQENNQGKKEEGSSSVNSLKQGQNSLKIQNSSPSASPSHKPNQGTPVAASKEDCKKGGWTGFFVFKNQGDCVSNVATKGKNGPSGGLKASPSATASASPIASGSAEPSPSASASASPIATDSAGLVEGLSANVENLINELHGIIGQLKKLLKIK